MNGSIWGKLIGGLLGLLLGGPFGLVVGVVLGHIVDKHLRPPPKKSRHSQQQNHAQQVFFEATFLVMGHIAKVDGRVSEAEIHAARMVMNRLSLNESQRLRAIELFTRGKQPSFNLQQTLLRLKQTCNNNRVLLQMFVEIQTQAAMADGQPTPAKRRVLQTICQSLGFAPLNFGFNDWFNAYQRAQEQARQRQQHHYDYSYGYSSRGQRQQQDYQHSYHSRTHYGAPRLEEAYALLGVNKSSTDAEVKRAYRRLMSQHHPDKLMAKGLPEEMLKMATEKTQKIKAAYEAICAARSVA